MNNFWIKLKKPFFILAPMDDVTDVVFREIVAGLKKRPEVFFTEFVNVDGLQSKGREALLPRLKFTNNQHPIVAQIWGKNPDNYFKTAQDIVAMGFDGIDINMGCPERKVVKNGCCAALIENHALAKEIIDAVKRGAPSLPISVKTRTGLGEVKTEEWINFLLAQDLQAITLHARTAKQMSKVPADWDQIKLAVKIRDERQALLLRNRSKKETVIIGNGDIKSRAEGERKAKQTGCDGIMIGRGVFNNLWVFDKSGVKSKSTRMKVLLTHVDLFDETWGKLKNFDILKKFFKVYISQFPGSAELRAVLMQSKSKQEVYALVNKNTGIVSNG